MSIIAVRYFGLFWIQFRSWLAYRISYLVSLLSAFLFIVVQFVFWRAVYANHYVLAGITKGEAITYIVFSFIISAFIASGVDNLIAEKIRDGNIAVDLIRPVNMISGYFFITLGNSLFRLITIGLPLVLISLPLFQIQPQVDTLHIVAFVITLLFGYVLLFLTDFIVGTLTFWTKYAHGLVKLRRAIISFFAGALVPLNFFPVWLERIAQVLPFRGIYYTPLSWITGLKSAADLWSDISFQLIWMLIFFFLSQLLWSQAIKHITIQGG